MFWIGLIVGIVIGVIVTIVGWSLFALKITGMSFDEAADCGILMIEAGQNRESTIVAYSDEKVLSQVVLEEN